MPCVQGSGFAAAWLGRTLASLKLRGSRDSEGRRAAPGPWEEMTVAPPLSQHLRLPPGLRRPGCMWRGYGCSEPPLGAPHLDLGLRIRGLTLGHFDPVSVTRPWRVGRKQEVWEKTSSDPAGARPRGQGQGHPLQGSYTGPRSLDLRPKMRVSV